MSCVKINYWTPVVYSKPVNFWQECGNFIEDLFYLGGRRVSLDPHGNARQHTQIEPLWKIALKASSFVFSYLIFGSTPLVLLVAAKMAYRWSKDFKIIEVKQSEKTATPILKAVEDVSVKRMKLVRETAQKNKNLLSVSKRIKVSFQDTQGKHKYLFGKAENNPDVQIQRIVKKLGRGGFGVVYELEDIDTFKHTALKIAKPSKDCKYDTAALAKAEEDLEREFSNLTTLNAQGKQIGIQSGPLSPMLTIVKDRSKHKAFEGEIYHGSLDKLKVHQLPLTSRLSIIYQIAKGVEYFRRKDFIHSDMKPGNILYRKEGDAFIVDNSDFGSAWTPETECESKVYTPAYTTRSDLNEVNSSFTKQGRHWSAKKQDIYSLGLTLIELLTGWRLDEHRASRASGFLHNAGLNDRKYEGLVKVLSRMLIKQEGMVIDVLKNTFGSELVRPSIKEVVAAIESVKS